MKPRANDLDFEIGKKIRQLRNDKGLSQKAVAENLGVTFQQLQKYENGTNRISITRAKEIAEALGVHFLEILPESFGIDKSATEILRDKDSEITRLRSIIFNAAERLKKEL